MCTSRSKRHEADRIRPLSESADYPASYSRWKLREWAETRSLKRQNESGEWGAHSSRGTTSAVGLIIISTASTHTRRGRRETRKSKRGPNLRSDLRELNVTFNLTNEQPLQKPRISEKKTVSNCFHQNYPRKKKKKMSVCWRTPIGGTYLQHLWKSSHTKTQTCRIYQPDLNQFPTTQETQECATQRIKVARWCLSEGAGWVCLSHLSIFWDQQRDMGKRKKKKNVLDFCSSHQLKSVWHFMPHREARMANPVILLTTIAKGDKTSDPK